MGRRRMGWVWGGTGWAWGAIGSARGERCSSGRLGIGAAAVGRGSLLQHAAPANPQHTTAAVSLKSLAAQSADDLEEALSEVMTSLAPGTLRLHRHGISWKACDPPFTLALRVCARAPVYFVCTLFVSLRACVCV